MQASELENVFSNYRYFLKRAVGDLSAKRQEADSYFTIGFGHRVLALCELLLNGDQQRYMHHLTCAGLCRKTFLQSVSDGTLQSEPQYVMASKNQGFTCALVAGDLKTARSIAKLSAADYCEGYEYEEDFLFYHFMQQFLLAPGDKEILSALLKRWGKVIEGAPSGYMDACRGLLTQDQEEFAGGLDSLLSDRETELESYKQQLTFDAGLYACEGKVFIEGLAILRLAEISKLAVPALPMKLLPQAAFISMSHVIPKSVDFVSV